MRQAATTMTNAITTTCPRRVRARAWHVEPPSLHANACREVVPAVVSRALGLDGPARDTALLHLSSPPELATHVPKRARSTFNGSSRGAGGCINKQPMTHVCVEARGEEKAIVASVPRDAVKKHRGRAEEASPLRKNATEQLLTKGLGETMRGAPTVARERNRSRPLLVARNLARTGHHHETHQGFPL